NVEACERHAAQQFARRRRWNRAASVSDLNEPGPRRHGRADDSLDAEQIPRNRRPYDIGDRVDGANFVEVDFLNGRAMHLRFGLCQLTEDAFGQLALPPGKRAAVDHRLNVMQMAMLMLRLVL